jgi:hypothetical protein
MEPARSRANGVSLFIVLPRDVWACDIWPRLDAASRAHTRVTSKVGPPLCALLVVLGREARAGRVCGLDSLPLMRRAHAGPAQATFQLACACKKHGFFDPGFGQLSALVAWPAGHPLNQTGTVSCSSCTPCSTVPRGRMGGHACMDERPINTQPRGGAGSSRAQHAQPARYLLTLLLCPPPPSAPAASVALCDSLITSAPPVLAALAAAAS